MKKLYVIGKTKTDLIWQKFDEELDYCWEIFGERFQGLTRPAMNMKDVKRYWGCIRPSRNPPQMTLNIKLVYTKIKYLRVVIFHELSHLIVPNHKKEFWQVMSLFVSEPKQTQLAMEKEYRKVLREVAVVIK